MIETLEWLCDVVATGGEGGAVIAALGTVAYFDRGQIDIAPSDDSFDSATVVVDAAGKVLSVDLIVGDYLALDALEVAFGEYRVVPHAVDPGLGTSVVFRVDKPDYPFIADIVADVEDDMVTDVSVRRDLRV